MLQNEVVSQASIYSNLLQLKESLFSVASKDDVKMMKLQLEQLDERWRDLPQIISKRLGFKQTSSIAHFLKQWAYKLRKLSFVYFYLTPLFEHKEKKTNRNLKESDDKSGDKKTKGELIKPKATSLKRQSTNSC